MGLYSPRSEATRSVHQTMEPDGRLGRMLKRSGDRSFGCLGSLSNLYRRINTLGVVYMYTYTIKLIFDLVQLVFQTRIGIGIVCGSLRIEYKYY